MLIDDAVTLVAPLKNLPSGAPGGGKGGGEGVGVGAGVEVGAGPAGSGVGVRGVQTFRQRTFHSAIDTGGRIIATARKKETEVGFPDYIEKAETRAVGRALAMCGYGTLQAPEFNEGERIADAPVEKTKSKK
jgi:hypothetical protein